MSSPGRPESRENLARLTTPTKQFRRTGYNRIDLINNDLDLISSEQIFEVN